MHGSWRSLAVKSLLLLSIAVPLWLPSIARATNAGWTGAAAQSEWSLGANWTGGTVPNAPGDEAGFSDLGEPCDSQVLNGTPSGQGCYSVEDDAGIVQLGQLFIDNSWPYTLAPTGSNDRIELTQPSGAYASLMVAPDSYGFEPHPSGLITPDISVPVVVMNDQSWSVQGYSNPQPPATHTGFEVDDISGSTADLSLGLTAPMYTTSVTTRSLTVDSGGYSDPWLVVEPNPIDPGDQPQLPAGGTKLLGNGHIVIAAPGVQSGPIVAESPSVEEFWPVLTLGDGSAPDGTLDVNGGVSVSDVLGPGMSGPGSLSFYIDGAASSGSTPTPSIDYAQLVASGAVGLSGLSFTLSLGTNIDGYCSDLVPGQVYTLVSAAAVTGQLVDANTSQPIPDGTVIALQNDCIQGAASPTVRINYNTSSTPETLTATVVSGGHAGDIPVLTGASPQISGLVSGAPYAGVQLSSSSGGWSGSPTQYDYTWYSCSVAQGPDCNNIVGDDRSTYTPTTDDVGNTIEACVDATSGYGYNVDQYCSDPTTAVKLPPAPELTQGAVTITGTDQVGAALTAGPGTWSWYPTFAYQWQRCGAQANSCGDIAGATGSTYTLTSPDAGQFVRLKLTASDAGGSTVAYSGLTGQVQGGAAQPITLVVEPSVRQVRSALSGIRHPSGTAVIRALIRTRKFRTLFDAPSAGLLRVTWTSTVSSGKGKHRRSRNAKIATGSARIRAAGTTKLVMSLTREGHTLLKAHPIHLPVTAMEQFRPTGGVWTTLTKHFSL